MSLEAAIQALADQFKRFNDILERPPLDPPSTQIETLRKPRAKEERAEGTDPYAGQVAVVSGQLGLGGEIIGTLNVALEPVKEAASNPQPATQTAVTATVEAATSTTSQTSAPVSATVVPAVSATGTASETKTKAPADSAKVPAIAKADLSKLVVKVVNAAGNDAAVAILKPYIPADAKVNVSSLDPADYQKVADALTAKLEEAKLAE